MSAYVVTTTADSGPGSLRNAINQVNADTGHTLYASPSNAAVDEIDFGITAATDTGGGFNAITGVATIHPQNALPDVNNAVLINGYSQPGASPNTLLGPCALGSTDSTVNPQEYGDNAAPKIELDGEHAGTSPGLVIDANGVTVQGLVVNRFAAFGIYVGQYANGFANPTGDTIQGNFLGTDVTGTQALGNGGADIETQFQADRLLVGGTTPSVRNIISGALNDYPAYADNTGGYGIVLFEDPGTQKVVQGNFIGTDITGTKPLGNALAGIAVYGAGGSLVGGPAAGAGNVISGNGNNGVEANTAAPDMYQGNFIGTDVTGTQAMGNGSEGLFLYGSQTIGGPGAGNLVSANGRTGEIRIGGGSWVIQGNFLGTDVTGTKRLGTGFAIYDDNSTGHNTIGGTAQGDGNLMARAIELNSSGNLVQGNYMGTDITGATGIGTGNVILSNGASDNTIGGDCTAARNVIAGGIEIGGAPSGAPADLPSHNTVEGNYIGTDVTGARVLADGAGAGIQLTGALNNTIGGTAAGAGNVIAGFAYGIQFYSTINPNDPNNGNVVQGNYIGTDTTGTRALGNGTGVAFSHLQDTNNTIGGTAAGAGNIIAFNGGDGVFVNAGAGNSILGNSIHDNGGLGIDLSSANNANDNQAALVLTAAYAISGRTIVTGRLAGAPGTTVAFHLKFFANPAGDPEGKTCLGNWDGAITFDATGHGNLPVVVLAPLPAGQGLVTATATDPVGNTSEFSAGVAATPLPPSSLSGVVWEDFNNDSQVDFGEAGIGAVNVTLTGTDLLGNTVNLSQLTNSDGAYVFLHLLPGNYNITQTQPAGYLQGVDTVVTAGGSLAATDEFFVALAADVDGLNYNFGEQPAAGGSVQRGQTAGIGFWHNKNGQTLIKALPVVTNADGSVTSVANWLAATLPNIFGANSANPDCAPSP